MNLAKAIGIIACACAFVAPAQTDNVKNWFTGNANGEALQADGATWGEKPESVTVTNSLITLENDAESPLVLTLGVAPDTGTKVVITGQASFAPMDAESLAEVVVDGVQAAFTVATTNDTTYYYGYAGGWRQLAVATLPEDAETLATNFTVTLSYYGATKTIEFAVGDTTIGEIYEVNPATNSIASVFCYGSGTLTSLAGTAELAEFVDKDGNKYADKAAAEEAGAEVTVSPEGAKQLIIEQNIDGIKTDAAAASLVTWLNEKGVKEDVDKLATASGANKINYIDSYKLGLDPKEATSVPTVTTVEADTASEAITLNAGGVTPPTGFKAVWKVGGTPVEVTGGTIPVPMTNGVYKVTVEAVAVPAN